MGSGISKVEINNIISRHIDEIKQQHSEEHGNTLMYTLIVFGGVGIMVVFALVIRCMKKRDANREIWQRDCEAKMSEMVKKIEELV